MTLLLAYYKELKGNTDLTYVSDVWLPEVCEHLIQFPNSCYFLKYKGVHLEYVQSDILGMSQVIA